MGIYKEEWGHKQKPLETIEDAVIILSAGFICTKLTGCENCPVYCYERAERKGGDCSNTKESAIRFLREKGAIYDVGKKEFAFRPEITPHKEIPKQPPHTSQKDHKCTNCQHKKLLDGGYLFCTKFHNTTIPEGYCHNFEEVSDLE